MKYSRSRDHQYSHLLRTIFFASLFETWDSGKKLRVSIRKVKIVKMRTCVKCFETLKYIINLLICNSSYHTTRIILLSFVTQLILCVIKTNLMHSLSSVYFVIQPLHVSGIFVTHQEVGRPTDSQLKNTTRTNCVYIQGVPGGMDKT